jgi:hypothetical protein
MPEIAAIKLQCDLVMRGGIASGLGYPRAIVKRIAVSHRNISVQGFGCFTRRSYSALNRAENLASLPP